MITLTWYGTFSLKLKSDKATVLFDPFIRFDKRGDNKFINSAFNEKNIFLTHGHLDHALNLYDLYKNKNANIHLTNSPYNKLIKDGINKNKLTKIKPGDTYNIEDINIKVLKGKHIKYNLKLILSTLFSMDMIKYRNNLPLIIKGHLKCREKNETVNYLVNIKNKSMLFMGSMALNDDEIYPKNVDYLVLAYQGRSDLDKKIVPILNRLKPKCIILSHFDNTFPPISKDVYTDNLKDIIDKDIKLIIPKREEKIEL